ncbi:hypothetical protein GGE07_000890 [Sinorhizobium terangae]|uniref:hypothetical protein n=1 Tax=Sinorhizobium terangae TaxID=110322 RepID=UPI0017CBE626|nr:hypothetical protein [Sinorhizobium terangae]
MVDAPKMKKLIWDCQKEIAEYLPPESGISEHQLLQRLLTRLDGQQAKEALGDYWQGRGRVTMMVGRAGPRSSRSRNGVAHKYRELQRVSVPAAPIATYSS